MIRNLYRQDKFNGETTLMSKEAFTHTMNVDYKRKFKNRKSKLYKDRERLSNFFTSPWLHQFIGKIRNLFYYGHAKRTEKHVSAIVNEHEKRKMMRSMHLNFEEEEEKIVKEKRILEKAVSQNCINSNF